VQLEKVGVEFSFGVGDAQRVKDQFDVTEVAAAYECDVHQVAVVCGHIDASGRHKEKFFAQLHMFENLLSPALETWMQMRTLVVDELLVFVVKEV